MSLKQFDLYKMVKKFGKHFCALKNNVIKKRIRLAEQKDITSQKMTSLVRAK